MKRSKHYRYRSLFRTLFWLALVTSYVAAVLPQELAPHVGSLNDKAHHILAFIVLGMLLRFSYRVRYWYALLFLSGYGVFIELSQLWIATNRYADINDVAADIIGSFIGLKLHKYITRVL